MAYLICTPIWILGVLILRSLRWGRIIRLGGINGGRLGHLVMDQEMYFAEQECGIHSTNPKLLDIRYVWTAGLPISNLLLLNHWKAKIWIGPKFLLQPIEAWNRKLPGGNVHVIPYRKGPQTLNQHNDLHGVLQRTRPHFALDVEEIRKATNAIQARGFDSDSKFVCLHVRDGFHFETFSKGNFKDDDTRNADIDTYGSAIDYLISEGYVVIRMGSTAREALRRKHHHIWDYAIDGSRSELLDLYLPSICTFFISTLSGPEKIAQLFRRPILFTNLAPLKSISLWMNYSVIIPKLLQNSETKEPIPWKTIFRNELFRTGSNELRRMKLSFVNNSSDEIEAGTREIHLRLSGVWKEHTKNDLLQEEFLDLVPDYLKAGGVRAKIGSAFLQDYSHLLYETKTIS